MHGAFIKAEITDIQQFKEDKQQLRNIKPLSGLCVTECLSGLSHT